MANHERFHVSRRFINVFFLIGGFLLWVGAIVIALTHPALNEGDPRWGLFRDITKDVGVVVFALALVDILWSLFGGEPVSTQLERLSEQLTSEMVLTRRATEDTALITRQATDSGVMEIVGKGRDLKHRNAWELIKNANHSIDMCGYSLFFLFENESLINALVEKVEKGIEVRLCVCDPSNSDTLNNIRVNQAFKGQMEMALSVSASVHKRLSGGAQDRFMVRALKTGMMACSIVRYDEYMSVVHYLRTQYTAETPVIALQGRDKPMFQVFLGEFEHYFKTAVEIHDLRAVDPV